MKCLGLLMFVIASVKCIAQDNCGITIQYRGEADHPYTQFYFYTNELKKTEANPFIVEFNITYKEFKQMTENLKTIKQKFSKDSLENPVSFTVNQSSGKDEIYLARNKNALVDLLICVEKPLEDSAIKDAVRRRFRNFLARFHIASPWKVDRPITSRDRYKQQLRKDSTHKDGKGTHYSPNGKNEDPGF